MAALAFTSSIYRMVPIAPVESDGASVVSRCPAQFRTTPGASTVAGAGGVPAERADGLSRQQPREARRPPHQPERGHGPTVARGSGWQHPDTGSSIDVPALGLEGLTSIHH